MNTSDTEARREIHDQESQSLYQQCRDLVAWGIQSGLLHRPPDEPGPDDALEALDDTIAGVARLSGGHRGRRKADQCFDEANVIEGDDEDTEKPAVTAGNDDEPEQDEQEATGEPEDGEEGE